MEKTVRMVKGIFSEIRKAIRLSKRTINEKRKERIKITEIYDE